MVESTAIGNAVAGVRRGTIQPVRSRQRRAGSRHDKDHHYEQHEHLSHQFLLTSTRLPESASHPLPPASTPPVHLIARIPHPAARNLPLTSCRHLALETRPATLCQDRSPDSGRIPPHAGERPSGPWHPSAGRQPAARRGLSRPGMRRGRGSPDSEADLLKTSALHAKGAGCEPRPLRDTLMVTRYGLRKTIISARMSTIITRTMAMSPAVPSPVCCCDGTLCVTVRGATTENCPVMPSMAT